MSHLRWITLVLILAFVLPILAQEGGITDPSASVPAPSLSKHAPGATYTDPAFGTTIQRITGASATGGFGTHVYSQLQAFSTDNKYILVIEDSNYLIRRLSDLSQMPVDTSIMNDIRWHPTQPHTVLFYDSNDDETVRIQSVDVETNAINTLYTLPSQYVRIRVPESYEELSRDGRWTAAMLTRNDDSVDIVTIDLENTQFGAVLSIDNLYATVCTPDPTWGNVEPDWIGVSPLGNYLIVQWARDGVGRCRGMESYNIATGAFVGYVYDNYQHGDLGVDTDGSEFFMTVTLSSPMDQNRPAIATFTLPGNDQAPQPDYLMVMDWATNHHISCQGPAGACLVSYDGWDDDIWRPFEQEIFLMYTDKSVLRVAHHRSTACGYWVQPRASISQDGKYAVFTSDWGDGCQLADGNGDTYVITLPQGESQPPPTETAQTFPANNQTLTGTSAGQWPRFTFKHTAGIEWYRIWIGPSDYSRTEYDQWLPAFDTSTAATPGSGICDNQTNICTIPSDIWLTDGSYEWWTTHWSPTAPDFNSYWSKTDFAVDFAAPNPAVTYINPMHNSTNSAPNVIQWQRDPNALWYHLWLGTEDYITQLVDRWINAADACNESTCTLDVSGLPFSAGGYEIWTEVWGPHAYLGWLDVNGGTPIKFTVNSTTAG